MVRRAARRYIKDMVYGANDGIITTFAVVAGVTGGKLPVDVALTIGVASLFADGFSMAASDYLGSRSEQATRALTGEAPIGDRSPVTGAFLTFTAFVLAGAVPLFPYVFNRSAEHLFLQAAVATAVALVGVGALRSLVTRRNPLFSALEMLVIGGIAALLAYGIGYEIRRIAG